MASPTTAIATPSTSERDGPEGASSICIERARRCAFATAPGGTCALEAGTGAGVRAGGSARGGVSRVAGTRGTSDPVGREIAGAAGAAGTGVVAAAGARVGTAFTAGSDFTWGA